MGVALFIATLGWTQAGAAQDQVPPPPPDDGTTAVPSAPRAEEALPPIPDALTARV